jgi:hypothetical protein
MPWARFDDEILDNPKVADAGVLGWALYAAGVVYCARNLTDGHIPRSRLGALLDLSGVFVVTENWGGVPLRVERGPAGAPIDSPHPEDVAEHLVAVGLWEPAPNGYRVHDYLDYNPSRDEVEQKRESARDRQARRRAKSSASHRESQRDAQRDSHVSSRHPVPVPPKDESVPKDESALTRERAALSFLLADLIEGNGSKRPTVTKAWADAERLLLERDGRARDEAEALLRWCQADDFWRSNVLSMPKFRAKYDQLRLHQQRTGRPLVDPSREDQRDRFMRRRWGSLLDALPDLDPDAVVEAATEIAGSDEPVTVEAVRARVMAVAA